MMLASRLCQVQCCSTDQCSVQLICMHVQSGVVMPHVQPSIIAEFVNHQSEVRRRAGRLQEIYEGLHAKVEQAQLQLAPSGPTLVGIARALTLTLPRAQTTVAERICGVVEPTALAVDNLMTGFSIPVRFHS